MKLRISASVTLNMFGNAGYTPTDARPSMINALTVRDNWDERTITWNNAPYAAENIAVTKVFPVAMQPPGPYQWDVSAAVADAYRDGLPLRLAFYSTDGDYHSGKYFYTSDSNDWNGTVRPTLEVKSRRVGGSTYQVPVEVKPHRANTLALRWLVSYAKGRREKTMTERLQNEILDASNGLGAAVKRREDTHKMAESNRAFAHYRW